MAEATIRDLVRLVGPARFGFQDRVQQAAVEAIELAGKVAPAIGEISVEEAQYVIVREFGKALGVELPEEGSTRS